MNQDFLTLYKTQVPTKPPASVIEDLEGRFWAAANGLDLSKEETFVKWKTMESVWYVWFKDNCPDIDDNVRLGETLREVYAVYRVYRNKRAVVVFDS